MREIYCHTCGTLVARLAVGSKIRTGSKHICADCYGKQNGIPEFLRGMMGGRKK